jgi:hypothetical protein
MPVVLNLFLSARYTLIPPIIAAAQHHCVLYAKYGKTDSHSSFYKHFTWREPAAHFCAPALIFRSRQIIESV